MEKKVLKHLIDVAAGRTPADLVFKNCNVIDVYNGTVFCADIAVCDSLIAAVGSGYSGLQEIDAHGKFAAPGFIDSHIHIESSYVTPEEIGRLLVPHGSATIIADPHEIVNVCGMDGLKYMMDAADKTALNIEFMLPSCVPSTSFEHAGARLNAADTSAALELYDLLGLGEFMDYPGVISASDAALEKLLAAKQLSKIIDGHSPAVRGKDLNAYIAAGIHTDHECANAYALQQRVAKGMYVLLRQGSACHDLRNLLQGVTPQNSRRCVLCSDDRQPKTILEEGHLDNHLRICVEEGIDPITAIQMATINAAECFGLQDRGAIAPGLRADIVFLKDLQRFTVSDVYIGGQHVANSGQYLLPVVRADSSSVSGSFHVTDFHKDKLKLHLTTEDAYVIGIQPGGVVTKKSIEKVARSADGDFVFSPDKDIVKMAVVERHQGTGNVAVGLLKGYGIKKGAVALSIAHDSHNIIAAGVDNDELAFAIQTLLAQNGGIVLTHGGSVIESLPLPIGGLMCEQSGEWVNEKLTAIHHAAHNILGIENTVEPIMTLCFMSLPVIPEIKLTDMGLFDVEKFDFISVDANMQNR